MHPNANPAVVDGTDPGALLERAIRASADTRGCLLNMDPHDPNLTGDQVRALAQSVLVVLACLFAAADLLDRARAD